MPSTRRCSRPGVDAATIRRLLDLLALENFFGERIGLRQQAAGARLNRFQPLLGIAFVIERADLDDPAFDRSRSLFARCKELPVDITFLRTEDIPVLCAEGAIDMGITGSDLIAEANVELRRRLDLGVGQCKLSICVPDDAPYTSPKQLAGKRIATSFPNNTAAYLRQHGATAHLVNLNGSVESMIALGVADAVADVVETGATLRSQGLAVFGEPILRSEAVLIRNATTEQGTGIEVLRRSGTDLGRLFLRLVLGRHPALGGLLDQLLHLVVGEAARGRDLDLLPAPGAEVLRLDAHDPVLLRLQLPVRVPRVDTDRARRATCGRRRRLPAHPPWWALQGDSNAERADLRDAGPRIMSRHHFRVMRRGLGSALHWRQYSGSAPCRPVSENTAP